MELAKTNESVNRTFDGETTKEEVTSINYNLVDNGNVVGSASISNGYFSISGSIPGTMDELKAKVEAMFAAE